MNKRRIFIKVFLIILTVAVYVIESNLPNILLGVQGARIGFANVLVMIAMFSFSNVFAFVLVLIKCIFGPIITGAYGSIIYSLCGGLISLFAMILLKRGLRDKIGYVGLSISGAFIHNVVVLTLAAIVLGSISIFNELPEIALASIIAGGITGSIVWLIYWIQKSKHKQKR